MRWLKSFTLWTSLMPLYAQAEQSGWTSGGGHLISTDENPWFLHNVERVSYCISIDEANFGTSREKAQMALLNALNYWKVQFQNAQQFDNKGVKFSLGTQDFVEVSCGPEVDLRVQFGQLDTQQRQFLKDPQAIVGIAVRTDYDKKQLRGKGFLYVSPEKGELALRGEELAEGRWKQSEGRILEQLLIHEWAHIFGIQHQGDDHHMMGQNFPDQLVQSRSNAFFQKVLEPGPFLTDKNSLHIEACSSDRELAKVFGLGTSADSYSCLKIESNGGGLDFYMAEAADSPYKLIGRADGRGGSMDYDRVARLVLPDEQQVFSKPKAKTLYAYTRINGTVNSFFAGSAGSPQLDLLEVYGPFGMELYVTNPETGNIGRVTLLKQWKLVQDKLSWSMSTKSQAKPIQHNK